MQPPMMHFKGTNAAESQTYYRVIQKNFVDMEKMLDLLEEPVEVKDNDAAVDLDPRGGEVVFGGSLHIFFMVF